LNQDGANARIESRDRFASVRSHETVQSRIVDQHANHKIGGPDLFDLLTAGCGIFSSSTIVGLHRES